MDIGTTVGAASARADNGIRDINELYNIAEDPLETRNLIGDTEYRELSKEFNQSIFGWPEPANGMQILLKRDQGTKFDCRYRDTWKRIGNPKSK